MDNTDGTRIIPEVKRRKNKIEYVGYMVFLKKKRKRNQQWKCVKSVNEAYDTFTYD